MLSETRVGRFYTFPLFYKVGSQHSALSTGRREEEDVWI